MLSQIRFLSLIKTIFLLSPLSSLLPLTSFLLTSLTRTSHNTSLTQTFPFSHLSLASPPLIHISLPHNYLTHIYPSITDSYQISLSPLSRSPNLHLDYTTFLLLLFCEATSLLFCTFYFPHLWTPFFLPS